ncbi:RES domain-containing protein [Paenibacillus dendritiformis]|uniref:RES domain-containing protein n=1 Tax=Paenibacillus dendritiformis TaxID=130049 RepID=UPI00248BCD79|nr:RES domain-containing protein [Paenibacillus dendritiformis]WGU92071.1 RES domain-containing protein [Paenibacillus dendritiformis]
MQEVICYHCAKIKHLLDYHGIGLDVLDNPPIEIVGYKNSGNIECLECGSILYTNHLYFGDENDLSIFTDQAIEFVAKEISKQIYSCSYCSDIPNYVHSFNSDPHGEKMDEQGTDIYDFLSENGVDEDFRDRIKKHLRCQSCNHGEKGHPEDNPNGGEFENFDRVFTREFEDQFWGYDDDFISFARDYDIIFTHSELAEFREYLYNYPMLAYKHSTGINIYTLLQKHWENNEYYILESGAIVYRGRIRKIDEAILDKDQLWNPPDGVATHGRYNSVGVSVLYCADNINGLPYELNPTSREVIDVAKMKVIFNIKLFDMNFFDDVQDFISSKNEESKPVKKTYLLPNFIGTCCADIGYDGVRYKGLGKGDYYNFALFNNQKDKNLIIDDVIRMNVDVTYI